MEHYTTKFEDDTISVYQLWSTLCLGFITLWSLPLIFMPPLTIRGGGITFSSYPSVVRPLTSISRDAISPHLVEGFQW